MSETQFNHFYETAEKEISALNKSLDETRNLPVIAKLKRAYNLTQDYVFRKYAAKIVGGGTVGIDAMVGYLWNFFRDFASERSTSLPNLDVYMGLTITGVSIVGTLAATKIWRGRNEPKRKFIEEFGEENFTKEKFGYINDLYEMLPWHLR